MRQFYVIAQDSQHTIRVSLIVIAQDVQHADMIHINKVIYNSAYRGHVVVYQPFRALALQQLHDTVYDHITHVHTAYRYKHDSFKDEWGSRRSRFLDCC